MIEGADQHYPNHDKKIIRRDFLKSILSSIMAILVGPNIGATIAPKIPENLYLKDSRDDFLQYLHKLYGTDVKVEMDVWLNDHIPKIPENPSTTLLVGEFFNELISGSFNPTDFKVESSINIVGGDAMTQSIATVYQDLMNSVPIILATDNRGRFLNRALEHSLVTGNSYEFRYRLISGILPIITGLIAENIIEKKFINNTTISYTPQKTMTRRYFLGLGMITGFGVAIGALTKSISDALISWERRYNRASTFQITDQPDYVRDILQIHEPFEDWLVSVRDRNIFLRLTAFSTYAIDTVIESIQCSIARGHSGIFDLSQKSTSEVEEETSLSIVNIIESHFKILNKYKQKIGDVISPLAASLALDLGMFAPLTIRVNKQIGSKLKIEDVKRIMSNQSICSEPFLLMCKELKNFEDKLNPNDLEYILLHNAFLLAISDPMIEGNKDEDVQIAFTGNENEIDEVINLFGKTIKFSRGLFVEIEHNL